MKILAYKFHGAPTAETKKQKTGLEKHAQTATNCQTFNSEKHLSFYFFSVKRLAKMMKKFDQTILSPVSRPLLPVVHLWFFVSLFTVEGAVLKERWPRLGGEKKNKQTKTLCHALALVLRQSSVSSFFSL